MEIGILLFAGALANEQRARRNQRRRAQEEELRRQKVAAGIPVPPPEPKVSIGEQAVSIGRLVMNTIVGLLILAIIGNVLCGLLYALVRHFV